MEGSKRAIRPTLPSLSSSRYESGSAVPCRGVSIEQQYILGCETYYGPVPFRIRCTHRRLHDLASRRRGKIPSSVQVRSSAGTQREKSPIQSCCDCLFMGINLCCNPCWHWTRPVVHGCANPQFLLSACPTISPCPPFLLISAQGSRFHVHYPFESVPLMANLHYSHGHAAPLWRSCTSCKASQRHVLPEQSLAGM